MFRLFALFSLSLANKHNSSISPHLHKQIQNERDSFHANSTNGFFNQFTNYLKDNDASLKRKKKKGKTHLAAVAHAAGDKLMKAKKSVQVFTIYILYLTLFLIVMI